MGIVKVCFHFSRTSFVTTVRKSVHLDFVSNSFSSTASLDFILSVRCGRQLADIPFSGFQCQFLYLEEIFDLAFVPYCLLQNVFFFFFSLVFVPKFCLFCAICKMWGNFKPPWQKVLQLSATCFQNFIICLQKCNFNE